MMIRISGGERTIMIAIGSDHAAYDFKECIKEYLSERGIVFRDFGCHSRERVDYPDIGRAVALAVSHGECEKGLVFCGTGIGISISANKIPRIRAVVCSEPYSAMLSRKHNDTNVLALGSRVVGVELAKMIIDVWLATAFEGGRHQKRVDMLNSLIPE